MSVKKSGRKSGGREKGYWYRKNRGWCVTVGSQPRPLLGDDGTQLKNENESDEVLKKAYAKFILNLEQEEERKASGDKALILSVVDYYLTYAKEENRKSTYDKRGEFLFDFAYGLPARFWDYGDPNRKPPKPTPADYIHSGYGKRTVGSIVPQDVLDWLKVHKGWGKGSHRMGIQALKRAFNYCTEMKVISANPIKGYKTGRANTKIVFFTDEQEAALIKYSSPALGLLIKICIRTGARYFREFCQLTANHVEQTDKGMVWRFSPKESKNKKVRTIYVPKEIAEIVEEQIKLYPSGPLFRNTKGRPWTYDGVRRVFLRLLDRCRKNGIQFDKDISLYAVRHTFAKKTLGGYWTGKPATIEQLAGLMGNTRQVCWEHYGQWSPNYTDPLWDALEGG